MRTTPAVYGRFPIIVMLLGLAVACGAVEPATPVATVPPGDAITLSATARHPDGSPLAGVVIEFMYWSDSKTGTTGANGVATVTFKKSDIVHTAPVAAIAPSGYHNLDSGTNKRLGVLPPGTTTWSAALFVLNVAPAPREAPPSIPYAVD